MLLFGDQCGDLEVRRSQDGKRRLKGRFPYGKRAVLSDGGRTGKPRKEAIAPRAFAYRVEKPDEDIHLLVGHSYDRPLASRAAGTLHLKDADDALTFEAIISPEMEKVSWVQDILAAISANLVVGISPGFRIPPQRAVKDAEKIEEEEHNPQRGMFGAIIRTIFQALLYEISLVTRPAYSETQVEMRNWTPSQSGLLVPDAAETNIYHPLQRWRP